LAAEGRTYLQPELGARLAAEPDAGTPDDLSQRELEVLKLIAEAYTSDQIAHELSISRRTVDRHRENLLAKLGMRDRVELTRYALKRGLIEP
jgi:two-component system response regulator NreC